MVGKAKMLKKKLSESLELPKEIVLDVPRLTIIGTEDISIENHKGIIDYCEDKISINTGSGIFKISGKDLVIKSIIEEEILIKGKIKNIDFKC